MHPSVRRAAAIAKIPRTTLYGARNHDPEFRRQWDEALAVGNHALLDVAIERGMDGMSDGLLKWQIQSRFPEYQDQPKTVNQNLSLPLMSPEQREEEAGRILLRIAALGIPLISIDGEAIDISDIEAKAAAEADPAATAQKP